MESKSTHWGLVSKYRSEIMGFACVWIMLSHYTNSWPDSVAFYILRRLFDYGNVGVELFLLVSGIGLYYAYPRRSSLGQFYFKRYMRLLIPYVLIAVPFWAWNDFVGYGNFWRMRFSCPSPCRGV